MAFPRLAIVLAAAAIATAASAQQGYPGKPIRMIVPLAAASAVDNAARIVAQKMSANMGQQIVIENIPGAAGLIGTKNVATAAPDGYTIGGFNDSIITMLPNMHANPGWDILRDFEPVSLVATVEWGLVANNDSGIRSAADLIARAKAKPGEINYGSGGTGTATHLAGELLCSMAGVKMNHIPYKGDAQATVDLLGNQISWKFGTILSIKQHVDAGRLRALAVSGPRRVPAMPNVPTVAETIPGFDATSLYGVMVPIRTPAPIVERLNKEIGKIVASESFRKILSEDGAEVVGGTPQQFGQNLAQAIDKWKTVIRNADIKLQ